MYLIAVPAKSVEKGKGIHCTGTFIRKDVLITAAHCVYKIKGPNDYMYVLTPKKGKGWKKVTDKVKPNQIKIHPKYAPPQNENKPDGIQRWDVAIIRFPHEIVRKPMNLSFKAPKQDQKVILVGFGGNEIRIKAKNKSFSLEALGLRVKRKGTNKVFSSGALPYGFSVAGVLKKGENTKRGTYSAPTRNDSGGPLFDINDNLIGIASYGNYHHDYADFETPYVAHYHTFLASRNWLKKVLSNESD